MSHVDPLGGSGAARPAGTTSRPVCVLVGPPGSGKTTVGVLVARELGVPFRDVDADIEAVAGQWERINNFGQASEPADLAQALAPIVEGHPALQALLSKSR